jgi:hypothetical protein
LGRSARLPLPDGRVNFSIVVSGYSISGFAVAAFFRRHLISRKKSKELAVPDKMLHVTNIARCPA